MHTNSILRGVLKFQLPEYVFVQSYEYSSLLQQPRNSLHCTHVDWSFNIVKRQELHGDSGFFGKIMLIIKSGSEIFPLLGR